MKTTSLTLLITGILLLAPLQTSYAQLLKKIKERAEDEVVEEIFGPKNRKQDPGVSRTAAPSGTSGNSRSSSGNLSNTRGGGLTTTAPDVMANINGADEAFGLGNYTAARDAVRQAILGVEMEIGENILEGLPANVHGLAAQTGEDKVSSMSIGFVGLIVERIYQGGDQQLKVSIGNDAALLSAANMYLTGTYATNEEQNYKQLNFQGHKAVLEYDDHSGYTLSVPFGQSSVYVANGINFASEDEIMSAADEIKLEEIKKELGEQ